MGVKMIIFIAGVFSGHILVKKIILSELYCCNMIIFCKLLKIKIDLVVQRRVSCW